MTTRYLPHLLVIVSIVLLIYVVTVGMTPGHEVFAPSEQHKRMYVVFAAYLVLLFSVRKILKGRDTVRLSGAPRYFRIAIGAIAVGGGIWLLLSFVGFLVGGADVLVKLIGITIYVVPALALAMFPVVYLKMK